jgi:hypothetical protein
MRVSVPCRDCFQEIERVSCSRGRLPQPERPSCGHLCYVARWAVCCRWSYARAASCIKYSLGPHTEKGGAPGALAPQPAVGCPPLAGVYPTPCERVRGVL